MAPEIDNRTAVTSTQEQRYSSAQLDAANDMWGYFKRLAVELAEANAAYERQIAQLKEDTATELADANAAYEKRITQLKKDSMSLQIELKAVRKDRDALLAHSDLLELLLRRMLSSRTWRMMEPVRIVGRWLRVIISNRQPVREPLPTRPELSTVTRNAVQADVK